MKIKSTTQFFGLGLFTTLGSITLMSSPAFSATLREVTDGETQFLQDICNKTKNPTLTLDCNDTSPTNLQLIENTLKISELEGKAGGTGKDLFLSARGSNGFQQDLVSKDLSWGNGTTYDWTLSWDPNAGTNGLVTFDVSGIDLQYTYTGSYNLFNALALVTRADNGFDATMKLTLNTASFSDSTNQTLNTTVTSTSGTTRYDKKFFILDEPFLGDSVYMTQLQGTFNMNWSGSNSLPTRSSDGKVANSEVAFYIHLFDPPQSTPEPKAILGLLGIGALGLVGKKSNSEVK